METETRNTTAAQEKEQRFALAAELANDGLLILDQGGGLIYASASAAELLGFSRSQLLALSRSDLFAGPSGKTFDSLWDEARGAPGERRHGSLGVMASKGRELGVELDVIVSPYGGETFVSLRDFSLSKIISPR